MSMNKERLKMNNKQKTIWSALCFAALTVCLVCACAEPVGIATGKDASFTISINGSAGRYALSWDNSGDDYTVEELDHTIILSNGIDQPIKRNNIKAGGEAERFTVTPGHWDITVWAYLGREPKAYCFKSVDLIPGDNGVIPMKMGPPGGETPPPPLTYPITMEHDGHGKIVTAKPNPAAAGETVSIHAEPIDDYMFKETLHRCNNRNLFRRRCN